MGGKQGCLKKVKRKSSSARNSAVERYTSPDDPCCSSRQINEGPDGHGRNFDLSKEGEIPENAFGIDDDDGLGYPAFVGVVIREYECIPGMMLPGVGVLGVWMDGTTFNRRELIKVLTGHEFSWLVHKRGWDVPRSAVRAGFFARNGFIEYVFVGRAIVENDVYLVGRVYEGRLTVWHRHAALKLDEFEILCEYDPDVEISWPPRRPREIQTTEL